MSSTYSTNLRTELIGSGDQAGTWGNTTNTSLGSILEQAIAGVSGGPYISGTYPAVNFPTDADITLTANNGSVDQSRSAVLVITSSGSLTATRNVIAPASASKVYIIKNSTTGGQSIQIKYSAGTGVTIGNAQTMIVYGDGTNFYNGETALTNLTVNGTTNLVGAVTLNSTLAVTGATTFTGIPSGPTAGAGTNTTQLATTAFVTNVTGTLGTMSTQNASSVTITGGTINGVTGTNSGMTVGTATTATTANALNTSNAYQGTTFTASTQFSGPGTGLTGTAASLTVGTATTANALNAGNSYAVTGLTSTGGININGGGLTVNSGNSTLYTDVVASINTGNFYIGGSSGTYAIINRNGQLAKNGGGTYNITTTNDFTSQLSAFGYQKFPSGVIIQWGLSAINASGTGIGFPTSFPNLCTSVVITPNVGPASSSTCVVAVDSISTGSFNAGGTSFGSCTLYWMAIGY